MNIKFAVFAIALSALGATSAAQAQGMGNDQQPPPLSTLSRAQVQADTAAWRAAGLADEWRVQQTPDIYSTEYRRKFAAYSQWAAQNEGASHG
jgi:hypothetical protein